MMIHQLMHQAAVRPHAPFILFDDEVVDFATAADLALRGCAWLADRGIEPGHHVLLAVSNRPLFLHLWFALAARGAVIVPVAHDAFGETLRYTAQQSESRLVLTEDNQAARVRNDLAGLDTPVESFADEAAFRSLALAYPRASPAAGDPSRTASILYTSGTTGQPKGVMVPEESYRPIGEKIEEGIGITSEDRILTFLPLHHANPQMYSMMSALTAGCAIAIATRFSASRFLEQVHRYRATGFTYVGTVLSILAKDIVAASPSTLRWCVGGGAPLAVWQDLAPRLHVEIHELYGMTETGGMVTMNTVASARLGSVGRVRNDFDVIVLDDHDHPAPTGSVGEIVVRPRTPHVMTSGYYKKPEETVAASSNWWFHTGDMGRFDEEGFLHFEGRKKELIRRAGEMISPVAIELCVLKHPAVADCAVVGVPDPIFEEEIKLVVVAREEVAPSQLESFVAAALPRHMVPRYIQFVTEIPKTPTQKVQRFKLLSMNTAVHDLKIPG